MKGNVSAMTADTDKGVLSSTRNAFLVVGCMEASWAPLVPYVKQSFDLDEGALGMLLLCSGLGSIVSLPLAGWICMRFGVRKTTYMSAALMALALLVISLRIDVFITAAVLMIFGACTIFIDVAANVNGIEVERQLKRPLMSGFHGGYSLGTLLGTAIVSSLFAIGLTAFPAMTIVVALSLLTVYGGCRSLFDRNQVREERSNGTPDNEGKASRHRFYIPTMVLVIGLLCFIMYASEGAVMSWSAVFVNEQRGVGMEYAGFFYVAFAIMMTVVRLAGNAVVTRFGSRRVVTFGALCVALGFAAVALIDHYMSSILGFALIGLGAANIVPRLVSLGGSVPGIQVQNSVSIINALGYSGLLVGPVVIGFVAKEWGLETSFIGIAALAIIVAAISYVIFKGQR